MEIQMWLKDYQAAARPMWQSFFQAQRREAGKAGQLPSQLLERFIDLYPRGKQARGALAVLGYELAGGKQRREMIRASIALELMETAILIADDVFDDDRVRRGVPTIHKQWERILRLSVSSPRNRRAQDDKTGLKSLPALSSKKYGWDMAHITSIIGFHLVPLLLDKVKLPEKQKQRAFTFYCQTLVETGYGEALDIASSYESIGKKQGSAQMIHELKTVRYTTVLPLLFGALLAGAGSSRKGRTLSKNSKKMKGSDLKQKSWLKNLERYADALGKIFQIQDDILGSFGKPELTGKSDLTDLVQGRWTILIELLWQKLNSQDKQRVRELLDRPIRSEAEARQLKRLLVKYQVVEQAQKLAQEELKQGEQLIEKISPNKKLQDALRNLLRFMLERTK